MPDWGMPDQVDQGPDQMDLGPSWPGLGLPSKVVGGRA